MKKLFVSVIVVMFVIVSFGLAFANASADEAKDMVEKAAAYYQANGKEKALKEFNNPTGQFVKGELYVFAYDSKCTVIAMPVNPKLVGINTLATPDIDGKFYRKEILEVANKSGSGWVDYKYKNPKTNKAEQKSTYVKKAGDIILCCGIYK